MTLKCGKDDQVWYIIEIFFSNKWFKSSKVLYVLCVGIKE